MTLGELAALKANVTQMQEELATLKAIVAQLMKELGRNIRESREESARDLRPAKLARKASGGRPLVPKSPEESQQEIWTR